MYAKIENVQKKSKQVPEKCKRIIEIGLETYKYIFKLKTVFYIHNIWNFMPVFFNACFSWTDWHPNP